MSSLINAIGLISAPTDPARKAVEDRTRAQEEIAKRLIQLPTAALWSVVDFIDEMEKAA